MRKKWKSILCLALAVVLLVHTQSAVRADQIDDLKKKNEEDQKKLDELDESVDELEGEQQEIVQEIDELESEVAMIMASVAILEGEIEDKKVQIVQATADLEQAREEEEEQYEAMKLRIHYLYEQGNLSYFAILTQAGSMQDLLNKADYVERLYTYDRELLERYQETRQHVEELKETLEIEESELETTQAEYLQEQEALEAYLAELQSASKDYELQISKAKQQALVYQNQIKQQNAQIAKIEEERRKAAEEAARKAAQQNQSGQSTTSKPVGTAAVDTAAIMAANGSELGKKIAVYACGFVGNPYVAGGTSLTNGADCSGFTQSVYKVFGYSIPRTSYSQRSAGTQVSYADAQPGDLICYAGHVALYIGNGMIVHASSVRTGIKISYATYKEILSVRRIIG